MKVFFIVITGEDRCHSAEKEEQRRREDGESQTPGVGNHPDDGGRNGVAESVQDKDIHGESHRTHINRNYLNYSRVIWPGVNEDKELGQKDHDQRHMQAAGQHGKHAERHAEKKAEVPHYKVCALGSFTQPIGQPAAGEIARDAGQHRNHTEIKSRLGHGQVEIPDKIGRHPGRQPPHRKCAYGLRDGDQEIGPVLEKAFIPAQFYSFGRPGFFLVGLPEKHGQQAQNDPGHCDNIKSGAPTEILAKRSAQKVADGAADRDRQSVKRQHAGTRAYREPFGQIGRRHRAVPRLAHSHRRAGGDHLRIGPDHPGEERRYAPENGAETDYNRPFVSIAEIGYQRSKAHVDDHERGSQKPQLGIGQEKVFFYQREDGVEDLPVYIIEKAD